VVEVCDGLETDCGGVSHAASSSASARHGYEARIKAGFPPVVAQDPRT
jgi:hypothetical protein